MTKPNQRLGLGSFVEVDLPEGAAVVDQNLWVHGLKGTLVKFSRYKESGLVYVQIVNSNMDLCEVPIPYKYLRHVRR